MTTYGAGPVPIRRRPRRSPTRYWAIGWVPSPVQRMSAAHGVFRKAIRSDRVDAEVRGWKAVARHLRVPHLLDVDPVAGEVMYEDVFGDGGGCSLLLGDVIGLADLDPAQTDRVIALIDAVCDDLRDVAEATGHWNAFSTCVPDLYLDRIRPGGRIGQWYLRNPRRSRSEEATSSLCASLPRTRSRSTEWCSG